MIQRVASWAVIAALAAVAVPIPVRAHPQEGALTLLDVPYLPQTVALCGGAAAAMVMRYWGATGVYAEQFAALVRESEGGIRGEDLLEALRGRGWDARSFRGDAALVQSQLASRRPVVALILDRPGQYHYVVVVGWAGGRVIAHDPARAPFRVLDEQAFTQAWQASGFWTMLALPPATGLSAPPIASPMAAAPAPATTKPTPCDGLIDEAVRLAGAGEQEQARQALDAAIAACPDSPAPYRELAGLHALRNEWPAAAAQSRLALARDARDDHASRILATALFLQDDPEGALRAWNAIGEPRIEIVGVRGLDRTRFAVADRAIGLTPQAILTPSDLARARRRLDELPSAQTTRIRFQPLDGGRAEVTAVVLERPLLPTGRIELAAGAIRAATDRELRVGVASPTGGGEVIEASWRWWERRARVDLAFRAPSPFGGTWGLEATVARETFAAAAGPQAERWRGARFTLADWTRAGWRWELAAGAERWRTMGAAAVLGAAARHHTVTDRLTTSAALALRVGDLRATTGALSAEWRSATRPEGLMFIGRAGVEAASHGAPRALWPGAGVGQARDVLLRAHPLLDDGVIHGVFGRTLWHAGGEMRAWRQWRATPLRWAPALFVDAARAARSEAPYVRRAQIDAGGGVRIALPGAGVLRIDVARGLVDGAFAWSAGWTR